MGVEKNALLLLLLMLVAVCTALPWVWNGDGAGASRGHIASNFGRLPTASPRPKSTPPPTPPPIPMPTPAPTPSPVPHTEWPWRCNVSHVYDSWSETRCPVCRHSLTTDFSLFYSNVTQATWSCSPNGFSAGGTLNITPFPRY